ncbi:MAG: hypothetical protein GY863_12625 [bacterium]|nr:hypothetical protein [bacterium]
MKLIRSICILGFFFFVNSLHAQSNTTDLVKKVQQNVKSNYDNINSVSFRARSVLYFFWSSDLLDFEVLPHYDEYYVDGLWIKPDSIKYSVKAVRMYGVNSNLNGSDPGKICKEIGRHFSMPNPFPFNLDPTVMMSRKAFENDYGLPLKDWPTYPFAPGADSLYNYKKISEVGVNGRTIVEIEVEPKDSDRPGIIGRYKIDKDEYYVVSSDIQFNDATIITPDVGIPLVSFSKDFRFRTERDLYYQVYWLPSQIKTELRLGILGIRPKLVRVIEFDSYVVNPETLPEDLEVNKRISVNIDSTLESEIMPGILDTMKVITDQEVAEIFNNESNIFSSLMIDENLFENELLGRDIDGINIGQSGRKYLEILNRFAEYFRYNRIEGPGFTYMLNRTLGDKKKTVFSLTGRYGTIDKKSKGYATFVQYFGRSKNIFFECNIYSTLGFEENRFLFSTNKNTVSSLVFNEDYRDYYRKDGWNIGIGYRINENSALKISYVNQDERSVWKNTDYSLIRPEKPFRENPEIRDGIFRGINGLFLWRKNGIDGEIEFGYTDRSVFKSSFEYSYLRGDLCLRNKTSRNSNINIHLTGAVSNGELAPQRWFDFGGKSLINYYGNLRGVGYKAYTGDRFVSGIIELILAPDLQSVIEKKHSKLQLMSKLFKTTFWYGAGWSDITPENKLFAAGKNIPVNTAVDWYHEAGIGIGDRFNVVRVDLIVNNASEKSILFSLNLFR